MENHTQERSTAELFSQYAGLLWHWSWLLIIMAVLAGGITYYISSKQTPIYQASTLIIINGAPNSLTDSTSGYYISQQLIPTYVEIMKTPSLLKVVASRLGMDSFPGSVQVTPISTTQLMRVVVTDTDPERAAMLANTVVSVFAEQLQADQASRYSDSKTNLENQMATIDKNVLDMTARITTLGQQILDTTSSLSEVNQKIQRANANPGSVDAITAAADLATREQLQSDLAQYQSEKAQLEVTRGQYQQSYYYLLQSYEQLKLAEAQSTSRISQQDPALPNNSPIRPQPMRSALLAALVGMMIAAGIIFLVEFLDDTIRDPQEITRIWGVPVLGIITHFDTGKSNGSLITMNQPRAPVSEAYRSLRTNLQFASVATPLHTILVTSASPGDGKTTITANLGTVIAQSSRSVVVVDADLRRPKVHMTFNLSNRLGLTDQFIRPQDSLDGVLNSTEVKDLHVITSGSLPPNPSELLSSKRMGEILDQLKGMFNTVILDTPPMLAVTDALVLAPNVDGIVIVIKPSVTKRAALGHVIEQLQRLKVNILGIVVNDLIIGRTNIYYQGYSNKKYGKGYHDFEESPRPVGDNATEKPLENHRE